MTNRPFVSVIIPTYNRQRFIRQAITSVLQQTYLFYEVIVIDDASTDQTVALITQEFAQIRLICLPQNHGAAAARNAGIAIAQGDLIAFLDSDDVWHANYLERQVHSWQSRPGCAISGVAKLRYVFPVSTNCCPHPLTPALKLGAGELDSCPQKNLVGWADLAQPAGKMWGWPIRSL